MSAYAEKFFKNPLSPKEQGLVRGAAFAVVGLGGTGGFMLENLLRMGAEKLIVFDHDRFEPSNFNRQPLATENFIDLPKTEAAVERARAINHEAKIEAHESFEEGLAAGASIIMDGTDNIKSKLAIARAARGEKIPYVFCSAQSTRGIVSVFTNYRFEKAFQLPKGEGGLAAYRSCSGILCPAASLAGTLAASQAVNCIIKKPFARAPDAIFFDLFRKDVFWRGKLG